MADSYNLQRFLDAQAGSFDQVISELKAGRKANHWMWFIFPQLAGLGHSPTARYYALASIEEAHAFLRHQILGPRYRQAVETLLPWVGRKSAEDILGPVDALKLRSSLTLFDAVEPESVFHRVLTGFYGAPDERTLALLQGPA